MIISLIAAMSKNRVIGKNNTMLWKLPQDMERFRKITSGKPVVMGRKTFESIGRPLPKRTNIIITHDKNYKQDGCIVVHSAGEALKAASGSPEIMIIGGEQIFRKFLPRADRMYLTIIDENFEGDAYFPEYNKNDWKETFRKGHNRDGFNYVFVDLKRVK